MSNSLPEPQAPQLGDDQDRDTEPTLLEQMGGLPGLVAATLPIVVLIPVNSLYGLTPALISALGVAVVIAIWRIVRKQTIQPAISGLIGVAICAAIAWFTGDAKGYFLYGIWMSLALFIAASLSILFRWPAVGVIWKGLNGDDMAWQKVKLARRAYSIATAGWAGIFLARFIIQRAIYDAGETTALGITRIVMGWPLTLLVTALTVWMVRRADAAVEAAENAGLATSSDRSTQEFEAENE